MGCVQNDNFLKQLCILNLCLQMKALRPPTEAGGVSDRSTFTKRRTIANPPCLVAISKFVNVVFRTTLFTRNKRGSV